MEFVHFVAQDFTLKSTVLNITFLHFFCIDIVTSCGTFNKMSAIHFNEVCSLFFFSNTALALLLYTWMYSKIETSILNASRP